MHSDQGAGATTQASAGAEPASVKIKADSGKIESASAEIEADSNGKRIQSVNPQRKTSLTE